MPNSIKGDEGRLVCLNGHTMMTTYRTDPDERVARCTKCGAETIAECPRCGWGIPGLIVKESSVWTADLADWCGGCGEPMPWTISKMASVEELAEALDELPAEKRSEFVQAVKDASVQGPRTELGVFRLRRFIGQFGHEAGTAVKNVLVQVLAEAVTKKIYDP